MAVDNAIKYTDAVASKYANKISGNLNSSMDISRTIMQSFLDYENIPTEVRDSVYAKIMYNILLPNPQFNAIAVSWEMSAIDSNYTKPYGRIRYTQYWENSSILFKKEPKDMDGDNLTGAYYGLKTSQKEVIAEPYTFSYDEGKGAEILMTTLAIPIIKNAKFVGNIGIDVTLDQFKRMIDEIQPFESSFAFLVSNNGVFVAIPDQKLINQPITKFFDNQKNKYDVIENIKKGQTFSFFQNDKSGVEQYVTFSPLKIGNTGTPWSLCIAVPVDVIMQTANRHMLISIVVAIIGLIILSYVIYLISKTISRPLVRTTHILEDLAKGDIDDSKKMSVRSKDEIGDIRRSVNKLIDGLKSTTEFAKNIGKGDLDSDFTVLSEKDILGTALIEMRKSLKLANEEDKKRNEEDRRLNWATQGTAVFAELLRLNNDNMAEFSYSIISNLVKYIGANQGGLFVINDNDKNDIHLELTASYAFDRRKILNKKIHIGVGLVGRCVLEKQSIYVTNLPNDYINITSGLGEVNPNCLLIVPLLYKEEIFAVVELASFTEIEPYKIQFVEKVGESIASTIAAVKINIKTAHLLEESRVQSEELASQEEEMRQNMEEMQTTQEELERKANEVNNVLEAIKSISLVIEYDMQGRITDINQRFLRLLNRSKEEMVGKYQGSFGYSSQDPDEFTRFWNDLRQGVTKRLVQHVFIGAKQFWFQEAYTPIYNVNGIPYKVLNISVDITESMKSRAESEKLERAEVELF